MEFFFSDLSFLKNMFLIFEDLLQSEMTGVLRLALVVFFRIFDLRSIVFLRGTTDLGS